jgi:glycine/D-amino acid oxidase-like deaminating enzyme
MNLRSSTLHWVPRLNRNNYEPLQEDLTCDVAIVGSGISGALAAYHLLKAGVESVVMIDARDLCQGSIGASTALLQYELDTPLSQLVHQIGRPAAERCYRLCLDALTDFDHLVAELGNASSYVRRRSLYLAGGNLGPAGLQAECAARRLIGIDVDYLSAADLKRRYGIDRAAALVSKDAAEVDPVKLTVQLIEAATDMGLRAYGRTGVTGHAFDESGVTLSTTTGHTVHAEKLIFATGYETQKFLGQSFVNLSSTFAVVSEPVTGFPGWADRCLVWEAAAPYFYARTTADDRIMIGGEDVATTDAAERDAMIPQKTATLIAKFNALFPEIPFKPARTWAGVFAETDDGLPYIGQHPNFPHSYFSLGYGGNGITFALIAAKIIRDDLLGRPNADAKLFTFDRH